ncbi:MAG: ATP-binding protein [Candidatus Binatia bacterium]|nr:ATP-binding protein [Candidatus Binatia bacterium]
MEPWGVGAPGEAHPLADERNRINLSWLLLLRWGAGAGQSLTVLIVWGWLGIELPLGPLFCLIAIGAGSNLAATLWLGRAESIPEAAPAAVMLIDVAVLTGLLWVTGGPSNPFSTLYLVNIALAAAVLRPRWTWGLVVLSIGCFGLLFRVSGSEHDAMSHMAHGGLGLHFEGMFVAFAVSAVFIAYFVQRVTGELARREGELADARNARTRAERLASLGTLAAGAAHELSTPLSTIAVVARELERKLGVTVGQDEAAEDARLVREQVDRCRHILDQMSADAGEVRGDTFVAVGLAELVSESTDGLREVDRLDVLVEELDPERSLYVPKRAVVQALRAVTKNALEASSKDTSVEIRAGLEGAEWRIQVRDRGPGMSDDVLARVGEPFFTTKGPGRGMGLGVFLAQTVLSGLGGGLEMKSWPGVGTTAELRLPVTPPGETDGAAA